jgi:hypothetical protein
MLQAAQGTNKPVWDGVDDNVARERSPALEGHRPAAVGNGIGRRGLSLLIVAIFLSSGNSWVTTNTTVV